MENQERVLDLLEKIYVELQDTKKELKDTKNELQDTKKELKTDILAIDMKIENEISDKLKALFDHREIVNDKLDDIDEKVDKLRLDMNNLTMKVVQSDSQIIELKRNLKNAK